MSDPHVWLNGRLVPADQATVSVFDHGLLYGDGVFEGIRLYGGRVLRLKSHLDRLFDGAAEIDLKIPFDRDALASAIGETASKNGLSDGYVRLCVTRGPGTLGLDPYRCSEPVVFIIVSTISLYPAEMYEKGMAIITAQTIRNHPGAMKPAVKSLNYLNNILAKIECVRAGVPEALMLNHEGRVAECTGDNVFFVRGGVLETPPLSAGILPGITRALVMELARDEGIAVRETDVSLDELCAAQEMFLTGTAAEVIPVTKVDDRVIGDGTPGPVTQRLIRAFRRFIAEAPDDRFGA